MDPEPAKPTSTRLENLRFESGAAQFDLGGQSIHLRQEADPASFTALETVFQSALADYRERLAGPRRPGLFARLVSWVGRLFQEPAEGAAAPAPPLPPVFPPELAAIRPTASPIRVPAPKLPESSPSPAAPKHLPALERPVLRAIFADPEGVHVTWQPDGGRRARQETAELTCRLDSQVARSLQSCYENLGRLGYKVVGLDLLQARPEAPEKSAGHAERHPAHASPPTPSPEAAPPAASPTATATPERAVAVRKEPSLIVRLVPGTGDDTGRAYVAPVETPENIRALAVPDRLVGELRAASDPGVPESDRVTCLRCSFGKNGFKVVDVGLGEGKDNGPHRWMEVAAWSAREPAPEPAARKPRIAPSAAQAGPQPELSL